MSTAYSFDVDPSSVISSDVLPAGWYSAQIDATELRTTKAGNGKYINAQFRLVGNESYNNRCVWTQFHTENPSERAVKASKQRLNAMLYFMGLMSIETLEDMHGNDVMIRVAVRKQEGYEDSNVVTGFKAV